MSVSPDTAPIRPAYVRDAAGLYYRIAAGAPGLDLATAEARYINITGDTITGTLTLAGNPTVPMHAVTKAYMDAHTHPSTSTFQYVYDSVATMADPGTGDVRTDTAAGVPSNNMAFSNITALGIDASKTMAALAPGDVIVFQQLDNANNWARYHVASAPTNNTSWWLIPVVLDIQHGVAIAKAVTVLVDFTYGSGGSFDQSTADTRYVNISGDTMSGPLLLAADPAVALGAVTKQYVDNRPAGALPSDVVPSKVDVTNSIAGVAATYSRSDHSHRAIVAPPVALGAAIDGGTSASLARADHVHPFPTAANVGAAAASHTHTIADLPTGTTGTTVALGNHAHAGVYEPSGTVATHAATAGHELLSTTTPADLGVAAVGNGTTTARANHVHKIPTLADLGAAATAHTHAGVYEPAGTVATHAATAGHELLSSTIPAALGTAAIGVGTTTARADHVHKIPTLADLGAAATAHTHAGVYEPAGTVATHAATAGHELLSSTTPAALGTATVGVGTTTARADHVHAMPTAANVGAAATSHSHVIGDLPTGTTGTTVALGNHGHSYEASGAVATHDALATAHSALRGTATPVSSNTGASVIGVATKFSREDHKHQTLVGTPVALGSANAEGTSTNLARSDHVHIFPTAANVGADPTGTAAAAVTAHVALADPHPVYNEIHVGTAAPVGTNFQLWIDTNP